MSVLSKSSESNRLPHSREVLLGRMAIVEDAVSKVYNALDALTMVQSVRLPDSLFRSLTDQRAPAGREVSQLAPQPINQSVVSPFGATGLNTPVDLETARSMVADSYEGNEPLAA